MTMISGVRAVIPAVKSPESRGCLKCQHRLRKLATVCDPLLGLQWHPIDLGAISELVSLLMLMCILHMVAAETRSTILLYLTDMCLDYLHVKHCAQPVCASFCYHINFICSGSIGKHVLACHQQVWPSNSDIFKPSSILILYRHKHT